MDNFKTVVIPDSVVIASFTPGELGVGVGYMLPGIPERGEPDEVFKSVVWFPADCKDDAEEFAAHCAAEGGKLTVVREGIAL